MRFELSGARAYRSGRLRSVNVDISNGRIVDLSPSGDVSPNSFLIVPGFADVHVHLREPGFFYKETMQSGTLSAARGGYTAVGAMPNLNPTPDSPENLAVEEELIKKSAVVRVYPYGCITIGRKGETLCDFAAMKDRVIAFSDDGSGVQSESLMREAMEKIASVGGLLAAHCEDNSLINGGYIHLGDYAKAHGHAGICSESEYKQIERDLRLVRETGCRYHVCHISAKESVDLIRRAKRDGLDVSCETAPHYLALCDDDLQEVGRFKMNPPIRGKRDMEALIEGLSDGTIDMIATDHAPHAEEEKSRGLRDSVMGVVGLECAFAVLYTRLVKTGILPLERLLYAMTDAPRARFGMPEYPDDFSVFDLNSEYAINPSEFLSKGKSTPFEGDRVFGACVLTCVGGKAVYENTKYKESRA